MAVPPRTNRFETLEARAAVVAVVASFSYYAVALWRFVSRNAVDVPHWDLWDVLNPFFMGEGLRAAFLWQPGPHRQGLGAILFALSNAATGWSMRAAALEIVVILLIAAILALELKVALFGRLTLADALIAPLFFRMGQAAGIVFAPYPACVAFPSLLVVLGCRALLIRNERVMLAALAIVSFLSSYTGFAMFFPPALVAVLALRGVIEWASGKRSSAVASARTALVVVLSAAPALIGLQRRGFERIVCPDGDPGLIDYAAYVVTMINGSFGIFGRDTASAIAGAFLFIVPLVAVIALCVRNAAQNVGSGDDRRLAARSLVPLVLIGFSLLFSVSSSLGRICAPGAALNSRYVALMAPLGLGLYFGLLSWNARGERARRARFALLALLVAGTMAGALRMSTYDEQLVEQSVTGKRRWIDCVKEGGSAADCNRRAQYEIHPSPEGSRIDGKLEFLRRGRLSLFAPRNDARGASGQ